MRNLIDDTYHKFVRCWWQLFLTDLVYKAVAFFVLTPLVAIVFRAELAASGNAVLSDQDILFFFLGPVGCLCFITVSALGLGIWAIELTAMLAILSKAERRVSVLAALQFALANAWPVVCLVGRMVVLALAAVAPFLAVAAMVYFALLSEHDINYYLKGRPPSFLLALTIGVCLAVGLLIVLVRLMTSWFFALPLVVVEDIRPALALGASRERSFGHRRVLLAWTLGWGLAAIAVSASTTAVIVGLGRVLLPRLLGSLGLLTIAIGATLFICTAVNLAVNLLGNTTFAAMYYSLYRRLGSGERADTQLDLPEYDGDLFGIRLTPARIVGWGIAGAVVTTAIGVAALLSMHVEDNVEIIAHRGSSAAAPENTLAAVTRAITDGADWVEIDVQETADGEVVVVHDSDFMKVAGSRLKVWDATMTDLQDIDIGSWFQQEFKDERVPTLGQVLAACKGKAGVDIELKYYGHDKQLEQRVADIVESYGMQDNVILMSLKSHAVKKMKSIRPSWRVGLLMSVSAGAVQNIDADFLAVNAAFTNRNLVRAAHRSGKRVYVWTLNDAVSMSNMISTGVDGIITDKPALARSVLEQRASMSVPERLLLEFGEMFGLEAAVVEQ